MGNIEDLIICWFLLVTGPLTEKQIAYMCVETIKVRCG